MPGKQAENLLISIKKSQAFSTEASRSILPSKIIARDLLEEIQARSYVRKNTLTSPARGFRWSSGEIKFRCDDGAYNLPGYSPGGCLRMRLRTPSSLTRRV
jgi:hypothetical protein